MRQAGADERAACLWTQVSRTALFWATFIIACIVLVPQKAERVAND